jgi:quinol monooxygenase YgiN
VYTVIQRRTMNPASQQETLQRARSEFFPQLQRAPGFVSFYLVPDQASGVTAAIAVWQSKAHAEAFNGALASWQQTLDSLGHTLQSTDSGETVVEVKPQP